MEEQIDVFSAPPVHGGSPGQLTQGGIPDSFEGAKGAEKSLPTRGPDTRDVIEQGSGLGAGAERPMVLNGKAVSLVLYAADQLKAFRVSIDWKLKIVKIQASCPMVVILDHAANGYIKPQ